MFNLDSDPYEENDLAVEKEEKLNQMKELAREWAQDLKVAFQPNRFSDFFQKKNLSPIFSEKTCCQFFVLQVQLGLPSLPRWAFGSRMVQTWLVGHPLEAGKLCPLLGENLTERDVFSSSFFLQLFYRIASDVRM